MSTPPRPDETVDLPPSSTVDRILPPAPDPNATLPPDPPPAVDPNATLPPETPAVDPNATLGADPAAVDDRTCQLPADPGATVAPDEGRSTAAGSADGFSLDASAASVRPGGGASASASGAQRIGNYEVLRELGRGAMGVVYQARHVALNRVVALKMVLAGAQASVMDRARFLIEAEAVARLQHPNIVQIFEIGDQNGQPFFSLEFCEGGTLSDRLTGGGLPATEAAGVVEQLARAMDAAHRHGVVHRDLKPANILLTAAGTPKVTDFGLAKRLGEDSKATRAGAIMGTPSYMAPEQAEGRTDDVGPPADIYALGAILYDLLTGRPPFQGKTILETLTQVRRDEPTPPSRFTAKLPRDLETICLKCLAKDTRKRYLSAGELADDLRRFRAGEPITARPTPAWERVVMWCRRRPAAAALVALSVFASIALLVGGAAYADREHRRAVREAGLREQAEIERQRAEANFRQAQAAVDVMLTRVAQERLEYEPRMEAVRRDLLEQALGFYNTFLDQKSDDPEIRWQTARALGRVGEIQRQLGQLPRAEQAYRRGLELLEALATDHPDDARFRQDLAAASSNLGNVLQLTGDQNGAEKAYRRAADLQQQLADAAGDRPEYRQELAISLRNLGIVRGTFGQLRDAIEHVRRALAVQQALHTTAPDRPDVARELARTQGTLFRLLQSIGQTGEAEQALRASLRLFTTLAGRKPAAPGDRQELAVAHDRLGDLLKTRDAKAAVIEYREAIRLAEALVADFPTVPDYKQLLAGGHNNLAIALLSLGQRADADAALRRSLAVKEELATLFPRRPDYRLDLARSQVTHGVGLQTAGQLADAAVAYRRAADLLGGLSRQFPTSPAYRAEAGRALVNLGTVHQLTGKAADAERVYRDALPLLADAIARGEATPALRFEQARCQYLLATLLQLTGRAPDAEKLHRAAVASLRTLADRPDCDPDHVLTLCSGMVNLGDLLRTSGRTDECLKLWTEAETRLGGLAKEHPTRASYAQEQARTLHNLGVVYHGLKRDKEAEAAHRRALALRRALAAQAPAEVALRQEVASSLGELGVVLGSTNRVDPAIDSIAEAIKILSDLQKSFPDQPALAADELMQQDNLANLYQAKGDADKAAACRKRVAALKARLEKAGVK